MPRALVALPDGRYTVGDQSGNVNIYPGSATKPTSFFQAHANPITLMENLPNNRLMTWSVLDGVIRV